MDTTPIFHRFETPLICVTAIQADEARVGTAKDAIIHAIESKQLFRDIQASDLDKFHIQFPTVHCGLIASGDRFFSEEKDKK